MKLIAMAFATVLGLSGSPTQHDVAPTTSRHDAVVAYPEQYRSWAHVKTALVSSSHPDFAQSGGFRHIYANAAAVAGYGNGDFTEGASIVVEWIDAIEKKGAFNEGTRRRLDVMLKSTARFGATGGWGFEQYYADSRTPGSVTAPASQCYSCHSGAPSHTGVFSKLRK